jgi:DNA invertase Pin-like site-specific DNA recombinase
MKVAIYTRVSGKSNRQDAANQSLQLVEYCERQGWEYVEYTDRMSGTRADRAEFQRMFEDARLKHFDLVLFWALDRFSREGTLRTLEYLQRLDFFGVAWKSFTEQYLDSTGMFRDAVIAILATIAKQGACAAVRARCCWTATGKARRQDPGSQAHHPGP